MPELPEVETIARALQNGGRGSESIVGKQIKTVHLGWQRSLEEPLPEIFYTSIKGQTISQVGRRGKFLVIQLSKQYLIFHLRMSGDLRVDIGMPAIGDSNPNPIHDRFWAVFQDGSRLVLTIRENLDEYGLWMIQKRFIRISGRNRWIPNYHPKCFTKDCLLIIAG